MHQKLTSSQKISNKQNFFFLLFPKCCFLILFSCYFIVFQHFSQLPNLFHLDVKSVYKNDEDNFIDVDIQDTAEEVFVDLDGALQEIDRNTLVDPNTDLAQAKTEQEVQVEQSFMDSFDR